MRLAEFVLLALVGAVISENVSGESVSIQKSTESLTRSKPASNSLPTIRISTSTQQPQMGTGIPTTAMPPQQGTGIPTSPRPQRKAEISTTTPRAPVYIPLKEKEARTTTPKPNVKGSNLRRDNDVGKPSLSSALQKGTEEQAILKKTSEKKTDATELAERNDEIAESKEGFFSAANIPLAASIGAAIMFGGLAYYMQSDPEPISSRQGIPPRLGYDHGVRIVRPSDLTPAELDRLVNAGGYHVSGRSITHSAHPYLDYAKKVYKYVMPEILGGSSKEDKAEEKIYIIRHHHHQGNEREKEAEKSNTTPDNTESPKEKETPTALTPTHEHPYNRIVKKNLPKV